MTKILVAEDEPALLELFCEILLGMGHECIPASDGAMAIALALEEHPDVVVTDYMMPERNGAEVMRAVQTLPSLKNVPVILMSAGRPPRAEQAHAWRFLPKPVDVATFERAVREALAAAASKGSAASPHALATPPASPLGLAREEMLGWVSHEIKSPLATAVSATQLAMRALANSDGRQHAVELLERTMRQLKRIDELVNSLLDAAQLQDGRLDIESARVDITELVRAVAADWRDAHADRVFEVDVPREPIEVVGDRERLRQILDNLVSNAIKYGKNWPICISVAREDARVVINVEDHGLGIPTGAVPQIFDRFHRVPGQGGRGHGLGLFIAAALARLHNGSITLDSEVGRGSTFSLTLPIAPHQTG